MLKCYLWLMLCLQFALINAARTRRGSSNGGGGVASSGSGLNLGGAQEHVHIKVHIPDMQSRSRPHLAPPPRYHKKHHHHHGPPRLPVNSKKVLPTYPTYHSSSSKELPYDFDFLGVNDEDNSLPTPDLMHSTKHGPMIFTSNIHGGSTQHPISQQFMQQLFTPEIMSALRAESDEQTTSTIDEPFKLDANELMQAYFEKLNKPKVQPRSPGAIVKPTAAPLTLDNWSTKLTHKRKKYGNTGIGEAYPKEFYNSIFKEQQQQQQRADNKRTKNSQQQHYQSSQHQHHQFQSPITTNHNFKNFQQAQFFENDAASTALDSQSDELEVAEDASLAGNVPESTENMQTNFNGLKPISYHDMFGEYATPITTSISTTSLSSSSPLATSISNRQQQQQQQQDFSFPHETIATYTASPIHSNTPTSNINNNWLQYYQRPELSNKPHQEQLQQQQKTKKLKPKSQQQTQFVLQPPTTQRFASSPSTSTSSSSSPSSSLSSPSFLLSTSPISTGFGYSNDINGINSGSLSSSTSAWSLAPYDFVQQSHQQQLVTQQRPQRQQPQQQQHQQQQQHASTFKKRKNHTKRKRNRIIVE